jgi:signal transduction histidine kinase
MKKELTLGIASLLVAFFLVGQMTDFRFDDIEIQLHDTYYVIAPIYAFAFVMALALLARGSVKFLNWLSDKSKSMAIFIAVVVGIIALALIILIYFSISTLVQIKTWYPDLRISNYITIIIVLTIGLGVLAGVEIKIIKKFIAKKM